jgi:hypothetical protein
MNTEELDFKLDEADNNLTVLCSTVQEVPDLVKKWRALANEITEAGPDLSNESRQHHLPAIAAQLLELEQAIQPALVVLEKFQEKYPQYFLDFSTELESE